MNLRDIVAAIVAREGEAYTNNPLDKGGPTKWGITQATLARYRKLPVTPEEVAALTRPEAEDIYTTVYAGPFQGFPGIADSLLGLLVDSGVQHGEKRAMKWFQSAIGSTPDGDPGPSTMAHWQACADKSDVYKSVLKTRIKFYFAIIHDDPSQATFANGWGNRVCEFI